MPTVAEVLKNDERARNLVIEWVKKAPIDQVMRLELPGGAGLGGHSASSFDEEARRPVFRITPSRTVPKVVRHKVTPDMAETIRHRLGKFVGTEEYDDRRDAVCRELRLTRKQVGSSLDNGKKKKKRKR